MAEAMKGMKDVGMWEGEEQLVIKKEKSNLWLMPRAPA